MTAIQPGQEYERHDPREGITTRIRVTSALYPGWRGDGQVDVVTITPDGRRLRPRAVSVSKLHDNPNRRTGYRLVKDAPGEAQ